MTEQHTNAGTVDAARWAEDQVHELKAHIARLEQQIQQVQSLGSATSESLREVEATLRRVAADVVPVPTLREELNQSIALIVQLQDRHAEAATRLDTVERQRDGDVNRDNEEWSGVAGRIEQLERRVELWVGRQASFEEIPGRFEESVSLLAQQVQRLESRVAVAEDKAGRSLEGSNRVEQSLTQVEAAALELQRVDETLAERTRKNAEAIGRIEERINEHLRGMERLEMLAERIELHRAERQRLDDRALKLEQDLGELRQEGDRHQLQHGRTDAKHLALEARLDAIQEQIDGERGVLVEQMRKLTTAQERTKRRQMQETERELREMKRYVADLADR